MNSIASVSGHDCSVQQILESTSTLSAQPSSRAVLLPIVPEILSQYYDFLPLNDLNRIALTMRALFIKAHPKYRGKSTQVICREEKVREKETQPRSNSEVLLILHSLEQYCRFRFEKIASYYGLNSSQFESLYWEDLLESKSTCEKLIRVSKKILWRSVYCRVHVGARWAVSRAEQGCNLLGGVNIGWERFTHTYHGSINEAGSQATYQAVLGFNSSAIDHHLDRDQCSGLLHIFRNLHVIRFSSARKDPLFKKFEEIACAVELERELEGYILKHGASARSEIKRLDLDRSGLRRIPALLAHFPNLRYLDLSFNRISLDGIGHCPQLLGLKLSGCRNITSLEWLRSCKHLLYLDLSDLPLLQSLEGIEQCQSLETLSLAVCTSLEDISKLDRLPNLKKINFLGTSFASKERFLTIGERIFKAVKRGSYKLVEEAYLSSSTG